MKSKKTRFFFWTRLILDITKNVINKVYPIPIAKAGMTKCEFPRCFCIDVNATPQILSILMTWTCIWCGSTTRVLALQQTFPNEKIKRLY